MTNKRRYQICRDRHNQYYVRYRWLCFWVTHEGDYGPITFKSQHEAEQCIRRLKAYAAARHTVIKEL